MHISAPTGLSPAADPVITNSTTGVAAPLPTSVSPLPHSPEEYAKLAESKKNRYLDFMLANKVPEGPFDETPEGVARQLRLKLLIFDLCEQKQFPALLELVKRCSPLHTLPIPITELSQETLHEFLDVVSQRHPGIRSVDICNRRQFDVEQEDQIKLVAAFLGRCTGLESLKFDYPMDKSIATLLDGITATAALIDLNISPRRNISDKTSEKICNVIQQSKQLTSFSLFRPSMSEQSKLSVLLALQNCDQLERMNISYWNIDASEGLSQLTRLLSESASLKELRFSTDEFRYALDYHLPTPPRNHDSSNKEIKAITDGIAKNSSLQSIKLDYIGRDYAVQKYLIGAIGHLPAITELCIDSLSMAPLKLLQDLAVLVDTKPTVTMLTDERDRPLKYPYTLEQDTPEKTRLAREEHKQFQLIADQIKDSLARNQALASMNWVNTFSNALPAAQTSTFRPNSIADAREVLTHRVLANSANLREFEKTMVEVALSINALDDTSTRPPIIRQTNNETVVLQHTTDQDSKPNSGT